MLKARITEETDGRIALESVYHSDLVSWLKTLPYGSREWAPDRRKWLISALYFEEVLQALQELGFKVADARETGLAAPLEGAVLWAPAGMPKPLAEALYSLGLCGEAPLELAEVAWRFWQKHYHPDVGGDFETAARLNKAIETIRTYLREEGE